MLRPRLHRSCLYAGWRHIHWKGFFCGAATQRGSWPPHYWGFLDHTQRRTTVGRTPLDEWSARRRDLYRTTHNTHNRQTSMLPVKFEPTISAGERPQTYALDRAATGTGNWMVMVHSISVSVQFRGVKAFYQTLCPGDWFLVEWLEVAWDSVFQPDWQDYIEILQLGASSNLRTGAYFAVILYGFHRKLLLMFWKMEWSLVFHPSCLGANDNVWN
jgi:hypothetical protein